MTEKISPEEKKQAKALESQQKKEEKALAKAQAQLAYLEDDFKRVKMALQMSQDPYSYMAMEGQLKSLEMSIRELAHERGFDAEATMQKLGGFSAEDVKELGRQRLDALNEERLRHEILVKMGDPASREKFYEFEHKARHIVEAYGLDSSHLAPFIVPEIPPEIEAKLAAVPAEDIASLEKDIRAAEVAPKEKKGFFRKLFGGASKEEKQARKEREEHDRIVEAIVRQKQRYADMVKYIAEAKQNNNPALVEQLGSVLKRIELESAETINTCPFELSDEFLGPLKSLRGKVPASSEAPKENGFQKLKQGLKKWLKIGLFTAAAVGKPLPTADLEPLPKSGENKIEMAADAITPAATVQEKVDEQVFAKTHAKLQAKHATEQAPEALVDTIATETIDTVATPTTPTTPTAPIESIGRLDVLPVKEFAVDTAAPKAKFMDSIRRLDQEEKQKPDVKKSAGSYTGQEAPIYAPLPTAPVGPMETPAAPAQAYRAPMAMGVNSAPAYQVASTGFDQPTVSVEGIQVAYTDANGAPIAAPTPSSVSEKQAETESRLAAAPEIPESGIAPQLVQAPRPAAPSDTVETRREAGTAVPNTGKIETIITRTGPETYTTSSAARENHDPILVENVTLPAPERMYQGDPSKPWDWSIMRPSLGYVLEPLDTPTRQQLERGEIQMRDPEVYVTPAGLKIPHFLWEQMDPSVEAALEAYPAALEIYTENVRYEQAHDPYSITVWNGSKGMTYIIAKNNMLVTTLERSRANEELFGRIVIAVEDAANGKKLSVNGRDLAAYEKLTDGEKYLLALTMASEGRTQFVNYALDARPNSDGTLSKIDLRQGNNYAIVSESAEDIMNEIQRGLDFTRNTRLVTERLRRVEKYTEAGQPAQQTFWERDYPKRPEATVAEIGQKVEKKVFRGRPKAKNRASKTVSPSTKKNLRVKPADSSKTETFRIFEYR